MSYITDTVLPSEHVIYQTHVSWWSQFALVSVGILTLPAMGFGLILLLAAFIIYKSTELAITNKRIIAKYGFIMRDTVELPLKRVESIQVRQGIFGRIFGYGTVIVAGAGNPQAKIKNVRNPLAFRAVFNRMTMGDE